MLKKVPGFAIWLTGLPSSGKTTLANALSFLLSERGISVQILDSDDLRRRLTPHPTSSHEERDWFYDMIIFLAELLTSNGVNILISATAPFGSVTEKVVRLASQPALTIRAPLTEEEKEVPDKLILGRGNS
ncbi:MAG: hypothetical protein A2157_03640 [Deltaproteobacteria bacterium RBG_16_47_11]|nr:MAG: hypothetical protein A2157_03640 [Deltaproteobacteria bacterium RBG_16_47_11]